MKILDKGDVSLIDFMGGDARVVAAARVSNAVRLAEASRGEDRDYRLIKYLAEHKHWTPFEHSVFTFYVKAPLFVVREWQRHRIASYNEISGRYVVFGGAKMTAEFYIPEKARVKAETNKQGSVVSEDARLTEQMRSTIDVSTAASYSFYQKMIKIGIAPELARLVMPLNLYTEFYFTANARALLNFITLRSAEDAQWEIRQYSDAIKSIFQEKMPLTYHAYEEVA